MTDPAVRARLTAWRERRLGPLTFTLDGHRYTVPEHPARVWMLAVLSDEPADLLLDVIDPADAQRLWDDATDPELDVTPELLHRIGGALLTKTAGRPWWQATQLLATLADEWPTFIAIARDRNLGDPLDWPVEDVCAWVYLRLTQHAKPEDKARIDASLAHPPGDLLEDSTDPDAVPDGWDEAGGFMALAARQGTAAPGP